MIARGSIVTDGGVAHLSSDRIDADTRAGPH